MNFGEICRTGSALPEVAQEETKKKVTIPSRPQDQIIEVVEVEDNYSRSL